MTSSLIWGNCTWVLFHTMADKIKPEFFDKEVNNIKNLIKSICGVLPCPTCVDHARPYLKLLDNVKTQYELKIFLLKFHNSVNNRKEVKLESENILKIYKNYKLRLVINHWLKNFNTQTGIAEYMNKTIFRKTVKNNLITYMKGNLHKFN